MAFDKKQFRRMVHHVLHVLEPEIPYSVAAEELLLLTAAQESQFGTYLEQIEGQDAKGVFQMVPLIWQSIWMQSLTDNPKLRNKIDTFYAHYLGFELNAAGNLPYQIAQARVYYWVVSKKLPDIHFMPMEDRGFKRLSPASVRSLASHWKRYYNTPYGEGTVEQAITNYERYVI